MKDIPDLAKEALELTPDQRRTLARMLFDLSHDDAHTVQEIATAGDRGNVRRTLTLKESPASAQSLEAVFAKLDQLTPDELRHLAARSWSAFVRKEGQIPQWCEEDDLRLLNSLDQAAARADAARGEGHSGQEVRDRIREWTSR